MITVEERRAVVDEMSKVLTMLFKAGSRRQPIRTANDFWHLLRLAENEMIDRESKE